MRIGVWWRWWPAARGRVCVQKSQGHSDRNHDGRRVGEGQPTSSEQEVKAFDASDDAFSHEKVVGPHANSSTKGLPARPWPLSSSSSLPPNGLGVGRDRSIGFGRGERGERPEEVCQGEDPNHLAGGGDGLQGQAHRPAGRRADGVLRFIRCRWLRHTVRAPRKLRAPARQNLHRACAFLPRRLRGVAAVLSFFPRGGNRSLYENGERDAHTC